MREPSSNLHARLLALEVEVVAQRKHIAELVQEIAALEAEVARLKAPLLDLGVIRQPEAVASNRIQQIADAMDASGLGSDP